MFEYEIMTKNLEYRATELEKQLFAGAVKTVEPVKWQPKGGYYCVNADGYVRQSHSTEDFQLNGVERKTKEQAQRASIEMRRFNRLLALRDELCGDEVVDWADSYKEKHYLYFSHERERWDISFYGSCESITPYFTTTESAQKACDMLNSGEVEL